MRPPALLAQGREGALRLVGQLNDRQLRQHGHRLRHLHLEQPGLPAGGGSGQLWGPGCRLDRLVPLHSQKLPQRW